MPKLGVNIDHVATVRQARRGWEPDPILAAKICERAGADSIVAHLREDRRHINDQDIKRLRQTIKTRFNLEMSIEEEIVRIACRIRPDEATLVPERRQEITTEGGLDVAGNFKHIQTAVEALTDRGIIVSLFIDPVQKQIDRAKDIGVPMIELHTGRYAEAVSSSSKIKELKIIHSMTAYARKIGLVVNAGHGLNYENTSAVARIPGMEELNIGHSIISRAVFIGLERAVREMIQTCKGKSR